MFEPFADWAAVLAHIGAGRPVFYHAPLDINPVQVRAELRPRLRVRISPPTRDADPFTADDGHLSRFRRRAGDKPWWFVSGSDKDEWSPLFESAGAAQAHADRLGYTTSRS